MNKITRNEYKQMDLDRQIEVVNEELKKSKGTKDFGNFGVDFSYTFATNILKENDCVNDVAEMIDNATVKLFRKLTEEELKEKVEQLTDEEIQKLRELLSKQEECTENRKVEFVYHEDESISKKSFMLYNETWEQLQEIYALKEFRKWKNQDVLDYLLQLSIKKFI